jgi:hypothetical protein
MHSTSKTRIIVTSYFISLSSWEVTVDPTLLKVTLDAGHNTIWAVYEGRIEKYCFGSRFSW